MLNITLASSLIAIGAGAAPGPDDAARAHAPPPLQIAALRLGVTDVDRSAQFYEAHLGFGKVLGTPAGTTVLTDARGVYLVLTPGTRGVEGGVAACPVRFNFVVPDLDDAVAVMKSGGVPVVRHGESAVSRYATFLDPSGHAHNIKQLNEPEAALEGPRVYNVAVIVPAMARARAFYEGVLGFEPLTDAYYPPVIPMKPVNGRQLILSEQRTGAGSGYDYAAGAFAGLALATPDLVAAAQRLREAGVEFLHDAPVATDANVRYLAFRDPFGNVHELIEHVAPAQAAPTMPALHDLAFLVGTWRGELGGTPMEEVWSEPIGDHMLGMLRWLDADGHARMFELFTITAEDDGLVFRLRHFDGDLNPWASEADGPMIFRVTGVEGRTARLEHTGKETVLASYDASHEGRLVFRLDRGPESDRPPLVIEFERR